MRYLPILLLTPGLAWADDVLLRANVTDATVYPAGAEVVRTGRTDLPAGDHRLLIPLPGARDVPEVTLAGGQIAGIGLLENPGLDLTELDTPAQATARAELEAAEGAVRAGEADLSAARGAAQAAEIRRRWLQTLTGESERGLTAPRGVEDLAALLELLAAQAASAEADLVAAQETVAEVERALRERRDEEAAARAALERLRPFDPDTVVLSLETTTAEAGAITVTIDGTDPTASWTPRYDLRLDTEAGTLSLDRMANVRRSGPEVWTDVALTLSTQDPNRGTRPSEVMPDPARVEEPIDLDRLAPRAQSRVLEDSALGMAEIERVPPPVTADAVSYGLSVSYVYPTPVIVRPRSVATLALDTLDLAVETELRAVPRQDAVAYLMATLTNGTGEPILPGQATLYRDGARLGEAAMPALAPGAETEMGFGPLETIRLTWLRLGRGEGDRGIFRTSSTLRERVAFTVENTGADAVEVLTLYALPFSEQEDLGVNLQMDPAPDLTDWNDRRGVAGWEMAIPAGETTRVELTFEIDWPEGEDLFWQP